MNKTDVRLDEIPVLSNILVFNLKNQSRSFLDEIVGPCHLTYFEKLQDKNKGFSLASAEDLLFLLCSTIAPKEKNDASKKIFSYFRNNKFLSSTALLYNCQTPNDLFIYDYFGLKKDNPNSFFNNLQSFSFSTINDISYDFKKPLRKIKYNSHYFKASTNKEEFSSNTLITSLFNKNIIANMSESISQIEIEKFKVKTEKIMRFVVFSLRNEGKLDLSFYDPEHMDQMFYTSFI